MLTMGFRSLYMAMLTGSAYKLIAYGTMIVIPLICIIIFLAGLFKNHKWRQSAKLRVIKFKVCSDSIESDVSADTVEGAGIDLLRELSDTLDDEELNDTLIELGVESEKLYRGRWLPDPQPVLLQKDVFKAFRCIRSNTMFSAILIILGLVGASVALIANVMLDPQALTETLSLPPQTVQLLIPLLVSAITTIFLGVDARNSRESLFESTEKISSILSKLLPVYQDRAGVTLLISELISYGESMRQEVRSFSQLANQLVEGEFAEGVRVSIREVMEKEIAPPIRESSEALTDLAGRLTDKQESGMQELAEIWSEKTVGALQQHLAPLPQALSKVNQLTDSALEMMYDSQQKMSLSREENIKINQELHDILGLMAIARNDIANEAATLSDNLRLISESSDKLTALYSGEKENLSGQLTRLSDQLRLNTDLLNRSIAETSNSIADSVKLAEEQRQLTESFLQRTTQQVATLENLTRSLEEHSDSFTEKSSEYVKRTLDNYDSGLAEVVERLSFTTAEIREAIDSLPAALRSIGKHNDA